MSASVGRVVAVSLCLRVWFWSGVCSWLVCAVDVRGCVCNVSGVSVFAFSFQFATIVRSPHTLRAVPRAATFVRGTGARVGGRHDLLTPTMVPTKSSSA